MRGPDGSIALEALPITLTHLPSAAPTPSAYATPLSSELSLYPLASPSTVAIDYIVYLHR